MQSVTPIAHLVFLRQKNSGKFSFPNFGKQSTEKDRKNKKIK